MHSVFEEKKWRDSGEVTHEGRLGIIDIGSNSIRLVVYDAIKRVPLPLFNEKIFCGLGKGLGITGKLNPEGVKQAEACIKRFLALVHIMDVVELQIIATAAVRDASDGAEFIEKLERKYRISITVISGKKEAQLAAFGIFSSIYKPQGLAGDLGGGSIELIGLNDGNISDQATLPIGPLRLLDVARGDSDRMDKIVRSALEEEKWLEKIHPDHFYAIGGSFRGLAHIYMAAEKYPLDIVHGYSVKAADMRKFLKDIIKSSPEDIVKMPGAKSKRADMLIPAAITLNRILDIAEPVDVVFSSSGIREGCLYEKLSPFLRKEDPLIASCADLAFQSGKVPGFARELFTWMSPLFERESDAQRRLRFAACILTEIAWRIHPGFRGEWAFLRILQSSLTGLSHQERVTLALVLFHRYQPKLKFKHDSLALLKEKDKNWAALVGCLANLAYQLSGAMAGNLEGIRLSLVKGKPEITFGKAAEDLLSESVEKRVKTLKDAYEAMAG